MREGTSEFGEGERSFNGHWLSRSRTVLPTSQESLVWSYSPFISFLDVHRRFWSFASPLYSLSVSRVSQAQQRSHAFAGVAGLFCPAPHLSVCAMSTPHSFGGGGTDGDIEHAERNAMRRAPAGLPTPACRAGQVPLSSQRVRDKPLEAALYVVQLAQKEEAAPGC